MIKKRPKFKKGYSVVMHLSPYILEPVVFPATPTKPERIKYCHKVLGYSYKKQKPYDAVSHETVDSLLTKLKKELKNGEKK